jgi:hemerythrin
MLSHQSPFLDWLDQWTLEVGFMDEDHRQLAALLNRLARDYGPVEGRGDCPPRRPAAPPLAEALEDLSRHARAHFLREEAVMRTDGYPWLDRHKGEHDLLLAELSFLVRELHASGVERVAGGVLETLKDWLLGHILEQDRDLAEFLKRGDPPASRRQSS